ncbi:MAG: hypothetical protein ACETVN_04710 [Asgard group archaeon]
MSETSAVGDKGKKKAAGSKPVRTQHPSGLESGSLKRVFSLDEYVDVRKPLEETLLKIGEKVVERRSKLIGHIKSTVMSVIDSQERSLKASLVDLKLGVDFSGNLPEKINNAEIYILAVVHGLEEEELNKIVEEAAIASFKAHKIAFEVRPNVHEH